jgi:diketogulonate reductase-like aldo/keto reductase
VVVIPKSDKEDHIRQNADVYDFEISQEDMDFLTSLNKEWHCTWDPTNVL